MLESSNFKKYLIYSKWKSSGLVVLKKLKVSLNDFHTVSGIFNSLLLAVYMFFLFCCSQSLSKAFGAVVVTSQPQVF